MKDQYFGDIRDLFKFDLAFHIIATCHLVRRFTFIPMLTKRDDGPDGRKRDYAKAKAGKSNQSLRDHLTKCADEARPDISGIAGYFTANQLDAIVYSHPELSHFEKGCRREYFGGINREILQDSLILLDPDNGLENGLEVGRPSERHLLFSEVQDLYERMGDASILMIYQHFPHEKHEEYLRRRMCQLSNRTGGHPMCVSDNQIVFFLLTSNPALRSQLACAIADYRDMYKDLITRCS